MGLAQPNPLTLLHAAAVPRSVHKCWQRLSWGRAKHGSHAQNNLGRLRRRNTSCRSCFTALGSDRSRAGKSPFIGDQNWFCTELCCGGRCFQQEGSKVGRRLRLLSFCHPLCGLRDWSYLLARVTACPGQLRCGAAGPPLPSDLLL